MSARLQGAPTLPLDEGRAATLATVHYLGLGPRVTLTLWTAHRVTWESWQAYWNIHRNPWPPTSTR